MPRLSIFLLIILCLVFLGVYFWLVTPIKTGLLIGEKFDWPDETANYFWSKYYNETGQLYLAEPLNTVAENQIHPRSFNVRQDGALVPGSFLGLIILYGTLAKIFSTKAIIYFTPFFSILAVWAFYGILKRIFNQKVAILSAILLFFNPAWWYYSVTSMLPNVTFVACVLISIYFLFRAERKHLFPLFLAGVFFGLAISIRPAEIIWLAVVYLVVFIYLKEKFNLSRIVLFLAMAFLVVLPSLYQQQFLYGGIFTSGYEQLQQIELDSCQLCQITKSLILPFGFHPSLAASNFVTSYFSRFFWLSLLAILGLIVFLAKPSGQESKIFGYLLLSLFIFFWLIIYYGSWQFSDPLTVSLNTVGLSYVRYWLPLYLLALPFISLSLIWLTNFLPKWWRNIGLLILLLILFYQSANLVLKANLDSILLVKERVAEYKKNAVEVFKVTEPDSVIVTVRKDKVFFPERKVIHTFQALSLNNELLAILPNLIKTTPTYYYALGPEPQLEFEPGLKLELVKNIGSEVLYRLNLTNDHP